MPADPQFSIVIPTRDRPHLLRGAIESALAQDFDDYEVVVSDNGSDDAATVLVGEFSDPRLRIVRTMKNLAMPESWEFAMENAAGRYVTYLCDDDAATPALLSRVAGGLDQTNNPDVLVWGTQAVFGHASWPQREIRHFLSLETWTGRLDEIDPDATLRSLFRLAELPNPRLLNCVVSVETVERVRARLGRVFLPNSPDYAFSAAALALADSLMYLDEPLNVYGLGTESIGASAAHGYPGSVQRYVDEFQGEDIFPDVPSKAPVSVNGIAQSIVAVEKTGIISPHIDLDLEPYFLQIKEILGRWQANGNDVSDLMTELRAAVEGQPEPMRTRILSSWTDTVAIPHSGLIRALTHSQVARIVLGRFRPPTARRDGTRWFSNIQTAAGWLGRELRREPAPNEQRDR